MQEIFTVPHLLLLLLSSSAMLRLGGRPASLSPTGVLARELAPESEPPFFFFASFTAFFWALFAAAWF